MKPEPLKRCDECEIPYIHYHPFQIKAAVQWLKNEMRPDKLNGVHCWECQKLIFKKIHEAFEDVMKK